MTVWIILGVIIILLIMSYNRLVQYSVRVKEAWADIDVQLKRRADLIPNLVETVKGYAGHEQETLKEVLEARSKATSMNIDISKAKPGDLKAFADAQQGLSGALGKLFAVAEQYPNLKANENFLELQRELTDTENKIQAARRFYNGVVRDFNTMVMSFPSNLIAKNFGFAKRDFFELEEDAKERETVKVDFSS